MAKKTAKKKTKKTARKTTTAKAAPTKGTKAAAAKASKPKRVSGLDLAAKVLSTSKEPLSAKAIAERVIAAGWKTSGKTPEATLYAAITREIARKGKDSRFAKRDRGLFAATPTARKGA